jgi:hypothetical protein
MSDNSLVLLAFGVFSTALVLVYLLALWVRPRVAWVAAVMLVAGSIACFIVSEQQARSGAGEIPGLGPFILGAILAIAAVGGLVGATYGAWKARHR